MPSNHIAANPAIALRVQSWPLAGRVAGSFADGQRRIRLRIHLRYAKESSFVNREQVESAVARGLPFSLLMADGKEYRVPHRDYLSFPPKAPYVMVYDDAGHFTVLPLLTMTRLHSG